MRGISGRIALVTGAGGGIGAAVVRALHAQGARVVATDLASSALDTLADELGVSADSLQRLRIGWASFHRA